MGYTEKRRGYFTLTNDTDSYPLEFHPETLSDLLRRFHPVLVGGSDPSRQLAPLDLLREIGTRLWRALLPDSTPAAVYDTVISEVREGITPVLLTLPPSPAALPWELSCDPALSDDAGFLVRQRPLSRLIAGSSNPPQLAPPLRVLLLISSPLGLNAYHRVYVESERAAVESATRAFRELGDLTPLQQAGRPATYPAVPLYSRPSPSPREPLRTRCQDSARCCAVVECVLPRHGLDPCYRHRPQSHGPPQERLT
jgi:hypothetical protein